MAKVSVIVPVYNGETFIDRCYKSIINQTLKDIEIIFVDDGSTDNTPRILENYTKEDSRVFVIRQKNLKQGAARNTGIKHANGKYIMFIDSDDWIDSNYIEKLYNALEKNNVNIAISSIIRELKNKHRYVVKIEKEKIIKNANDILKAINWNLVAHSKMYRLDLIKDLKFKEEAFYEDAPYTLKAINKLETAILVPDVSYHYFSRKGSTIKSKRDEAKRNDIIDAHLELIEYAHKNNLKLKNNLICKDSNLLFKTKYYLDKKEYYLFGIKIFTKSLKFSDKKIFVIFQLQCFGDNLCCDSLIQNLKNMFPNSKIIMVVDAPWVDIALNLKDVDEVIAYDKRGKHNGILGIFKFVKNFPYKKIDYIFQLTKNERIWIASKLLKPRVHFIEDETIPNIKIINRHCEVLKKISHKHIIEYPIKFNSSANIPKKFEKLLDKSKKYVAFCTTTKLEKKDMPFSILKELVAKFNVDGKYEVLIVGRGDKAEKHVLNLRQNSLKFISLVNQTSLLELAKILRNCVGLISSDTGTMHYAYANEVPVLCVFNIKKSIPYWAPNEKLYQAKTVTIDEGSDYIYDSFKKLIENSNDKDK